MLRCGFSVSEFEEDGIEFDEDAIEFEPCKDILKKAVVCQENNVKLVEKAISSMSEHRFPKFSPSDYENDLLKLKVCLIGGSCGKSAIIERLLHDNFSHKYDPTISDSFNHSLFFDWEDDSKAISGLGKFNNKQMQVDLEILDVSGLEDYSEVQKEAILENEAFICVYDCTSSATFDELKEFVNTILSLKDKFSLETTPCLILATKLDLFDTNEIRDKDDGFTLFDDAIDFAASVGVPDYCCFEVSSKTGFNVKKAFETLVLYTHEIKVNYQTLKNKIKKKHINHYKRKSLAFVSSQTAIEFNSTAKSKHQSSSIYSKAKKRATFSFQRRFQNDLSAISPSPSPSLSPTPTLSFTLSPRSRHSFSQTSSLNVSLSSPRQISSPRRESSFIESPRFKSVNDNLYKNNMEKNHKKTKKRRLVTTHSQITHKVKGHAKGVKSKLKRFSKTFSKHMTQHTFGNIAQTKGVFDDLSDEDEEKNILL